MTKKKEQDRFIITYKQSSFSTETRILVDRETGVNYLSAWEAGGVGLTPLLDRDGKPIVTAVPDLED